MRASESDTKLAREDGFILLGIGSLPPPEIPVEATDICGHVSSVIFHPLNSIFTK